MLFIEMVALFHVPVFFSVCKTAHICSGPQTGSILLYIYIYFHCFTDWLFLCFFVAVLFQSCLTLWMTSESKYNEWHLNHMTAILKIIFSATDLQFTTTENQRPGTTIGFMVGWSRETRFHRAGT